MTACYRVPSSAKAIQSRLEVVLQLMGQLMTTVQLQHSTLLTLSRVACQTLTVQGVDLLQIKAAGQDKSRSEMKPLADLPCYPLSALQCVDISYA